MVEQTRSMGWWPSMYEPFYNMGKQVADWFSPPSEAGADSEAYTITVELPGVAREDVELHADNGVLTVKGEKKSSREESGEDWYFSERRYGAFTRSFRLPADADAGRIGADMKDGVLTIRAPKKKAPETKTKIAIGGA